MITETDTKEVSFPLILFVVCSSIFMASLDLSIVNISLPTISRYFDVGTGDVSWIILSYFLILSSLLLAFGRLGDLRGFRNIFLWGILAFSIGSFLCALAPGITEMVFFRLLQGAGGGIIIAVGPAIVSAFLPPATSGRAMGYVMTALSLGIALGSVIGGFLTAYLGWRWIFFVNVPLGIMAALIGFKALPRDQPRIQGSFDLLGAGLIFASLALIIYALNQGNELGWESNLITGAFSLGIFCGIAFLIRERRNPEPLVDLRLFNNLSFLLPNFGGLLMVLAFGGALFVLPFYMELGLGFPTMVASLFLTIASIAAAVSAPLGGGLYDRLGPRIACLIASGSSLLAFLLFFSLGVGEPQRMILVLALALMGISYGMYAPPTLSIVLGLCPQNQGQASSIMMTFRTMGIMIGIALFETAFSVTSQGEASLHQASSQIIALGFHQAVFLGVLVSLMALAISLTIRK